MTGIHEYTCECGFGWQGGGDNKLCTRINHCDDVKCGWAESTCNNKGGGHYVCNCVAGWCVDSVCDPVDECGGIGSICTDSINALSCKYGLRIECGGLNMAVPMCRRVRWHRVRESTDQNVL